MKKRVALVASCSALARLGCRPTPSSKVIDWLSANERNLVVDSIILGELCIGILALAPGRGRCTFQQRGDLSFSGELASPRPVRGARPWQSFLV